VVAIERPDIHLYADYRQYLKDWWTWRKKTSKVASFRALGMKAGTSPSLFKDILEGRRRLTLESIGKFAPAMGLTTPEASYLSLLAQFGNARTVQEKNAAFHEMAKIRRRLFLKFLPPQQYALWSDWLHATVREMVGLEVFREDPAWIGRTIHPPVSPREVREALKTLEHLELLHRDAAGRLQARDPAVSTEYEPPSAVVRHFNQEMIGLAMSAPDRFAPQDREIGGVTLGLSRECYDRIKERIRMFKEDVVGMVVEDKNGSDLVAQLNIQLFPLAIPEDKP
jgi:uncharacterized protein (TIGR02147 family)